MAHGERLCPGCGQMVVGHICQKMVAADHWESNSILRRKAVQVEGEHSETKESFNQLRRYILGGVQEILSAKDLKRAQEVATSMAVIVDNIRPDRFDSVTARRLADGHKAKALPTPKTKKEIEAQIPIIEDGLRALQSLDDLGTEANKKVQDDMDILFDRLRKMKKDLKKS